MLTLSSAAPYLLDAGFLDPATFVHGGAFAADVSRRNTNIRVWERDSGAAYFLKSARSPEAAKAVTHEALVYRFLHESTSPALSQAIPAFFLHNPDDGVLVLEALPDARNLQTDLRSSLSAAARLFGKLGQALARLHQITLADVEHMPGFAWRTPPWVFSYHTLDLEQLSAISRAQQELAVVVHQRPELLEQFQRLTAEWRPSRLIHGDLKLENLLSFRRPEQRRSIAIIDWEFARVGDPAWDLGSIFASLLSVWALSVPIADGTAAGVRADLASAPLEKIQALIGEVWRAYGHTGQAPAPDFLASAVRHSGARLIQTAHEYLTYSSGMSGSTALLVQLGANLMLEPERASRELLELS